MPLPPTHPPSYEGISVARIPKTQDDQGGTDGVDYIIAEEITNVIPLRRVDPGLTPDLSPVRSIHPSGHMDPTPDEWDELEITLPADRHIYRSSALGGCLASLVAAALDRSAQPMPESLQPRLDEGTALEPIILARFHEEFGYRRATYPELAELTRQGVIAGYDAQYQQVQVYLEVGKSALLTAHPDEIATHNKQNQKKATAFYDVEVKAFGPDLWDLYKRAGIVAFPRYVWQVSSRHAAHGLPIVFVVGKKANDGTEISEIDVKVLTDGDLYPPAQVKARILKAEKYVRDEDVPPCEDGSWPCRFYQQPFCLGKPKELGEELEDVTLGNLLALFYAYTVDMSDTDEQKQAKKDRDEIKAKIDKHCANAGIERSKKWVVKSEVGEAFEFEWVIRPVAARAATQQNFPQVKLID